MPGPVSVACPESSAATPSSQPSTRDNGKKRKRDLLGSDAGAASEHGSARTLKRKPPTAYLTSHDLLAALTKSCLEDAHVDFSGSYPVSASSPTDADGVSDKQRVQMAANDVWKATGYRFSVQDHRHTPHGHKTRFRCSQDEARRSHRGRPLKGGTGGPTPMQRFACRGRLRITCVTGGGDGDSDNDGEFENRRKGKGRRGGTGRGEGEGRVVTVRMQHCLRHEAYRGSETAPTPGQAGFSTGVIAGLRASASTITGGGAGRRAAPLPHFPSAPLDPIALSDTTAGIATSEENPTIKTLGAPWPTPVADFLDDLYARDEAEKAEATERLRAKEERQAQRRRKSEVQAADRTTTGHGKGKRKTPDRRTSCSPGIPDRDGQDDGDGTAAPAPETKSATVAAVGDDVDGMPTRSSKRRRLDPVVVPPPELPTGSNSAPPSTSSLHRSSSTTITGISPSPSPAPLKACQNCGNTAPSGPKGACALTPGRCTCHPCSEYARTPRELQRQWRTAGAGPKCGKCGMTRAFSNVEVRGGLCLACYTSGRNALSLGPSV